MNRLTKRLFFGLSMLLLVVLAAFSQAKYEKEYRIKRSQVPEIALSFVDSLGFNSRIRWFKEDGLSENSIEAKTRFRRERYSVEFSENGEFQDVEIQIKRNKVPANIISKIKAFFSSEYQGFNIEKIQIQYSGERNRVLNFLRENMKSPLGITMVYEMVVTVKKNGVFTLMEYTFSATGDYVQRKQIVERRSNIGEF